MALSMEIMKVALLCSCHLCSSTSRYCSLASRVFGMPVLSAVLDFEAATVRCMDARGSLPHTDQCPDIYNVGTSHGSFVLDFQSGVVRDGEHDASNVSGNEQRSSINMSAFHAMPSTCNTFATHGATAETSESHFAGATQVPLHGGIPVYRGPPHEYRRFGPCNRVCRHCGATFWDEEKLASSTVRRGPIYHRCCLEGRVKLFTIKEYPPLIQELFSNDHFLDHIRAYNQMFADSSTAQNNTTQF